MVDEAYADVSARQYFQKPQVWECPLLHDPTGQAMTLAKLPPECVDRIIQFLPRETYLQFSETCHKYKSLCSKNERYVKELKFAIRWLMNNCIHPRPVRSVYELYEQHRRSRLHFEGPMQAYGGLEKFVDMPVITIPSATFKKQSILNAMKAPVMRNEMGDRVYLCWAIVSKEGDFFRFGEPQITVLNHERKTIEVKDLHPQHHLFVSLKVEELTSAQFEDRLQGLLNYRRTELAEPIREQPDFAMMGWISLHSLYKEFKDPEVVLWNPKKTAEENIDTWQSKSQTVQAATPSNQERSIVPRRSRVTVEEV